MITITIITITIIDIAPAILSYFPGPFPPDPDPRFPSFYGGEFIMRCMGLKIFVSPQDNLIAVYFIIFNTITIVHINTIFCKCLLDFFNNIIGIPVIS